MTQEMGAARITGFYLVLMLVFYAYSAISMAVLGLVVPFIGPISAMRHVSGGDVGTSLSYFSAPAALVSFLFGMVVDRIGVKRAFLLSVGLTVLGDMILFSTSTLWSLRGGLMLCGCGFAFATSGAPALFMRYFPVVNRGQALAFWSTFGPAGFSVGLLMAVPFLGHVRWDWACLAHIGMMLGILVVGMVLLSRLKEPEGEAGDVSDTGRAVGRLSPWLVVMLGLTVTLPNGIAYGTSLVAPAYLARVHTVSLATSTTEVALIKLGVMLVGGGIVSLWMGSERRSRMMFCVMAGIGLLAQWLLFFPGSSFLLASFGLFLWTFAYSGLSGAGMSLLPVVATDGRTRGAVAGTVGQFISVSSVLVPSLYFSTARWTSYMLFAVLALGLGCVTVYRVRRERA